MTEDQWDRTIDVNLKGTFFACRFAIPALITSQGSIVAISSDYGLVGGPGAAIYNASKFGVNGIVKSLALELAPHGVRVNSVCPADVETPVLVSSAPTRSRPRWCSWPRTRQRRSRASASPSNGASRRGTDPALPRV
jgi:NAD(P)-dependent dehydrogenase (short-subunit alcohol dehydrogenase family)